MKTVNFDQINKSVEVRTRQDLLQALLATELNVLMACKGQGLCSTCHVYVEEGHQQLTPKNDREMKTLSRVSGANENSRLACQCRVLGDGIKVKLPDGVFIEKMEDLLNFIGKRAEKSILHPIDGSILVQKGKVVTRSRIRMLKELQVKIDEIKTHISK